MYVRPPKGDDVLQRIGATQRSILKAVNPQYGLAESPGYWWQTFRDWYVPDLDMTSSSLDPDLFFKTETNGLDGIQDTQVDDACGGGSNDFTVLEADKSKSFTSKP